MLRAIDGSCQHAQSLPGEAFPVSVAGSPDSPMRGRDAEWRIVCELLRRAKRGHGGVLLVEGEGGTGKSLLLDESARKAAGQGFSLATSGADELAHAIPLFALVTALNKPFDESTADDRPDRLWRQIGQLQARLEQQATVAPVLVCLDDLQWASRATLRLRVCPISVLAAR